jgi:hypothetical protein
MRMELVQIVSGKKTLKGRFWWTPLSERTNDGRGMGISLTTQRKKC